MRRVGHEWKVVTAVLLVASLSGCIGGNKLVVVTETAAGTSPAEFNGTIQEGKGVLEGYVLNPEGASLKGAHVALPGTKYFTSTSRKGYFVFPGLDPGSYTLRVDQENYISHSRHVNVLEGKVATVDITLEPAQGVAPGQLEHFHDLWEGKPDKLLFDAEARFQTSTNTKKTLFPTAVCVNGAGTGNTVCHHAPFFLPENKVVPPWTEKLQVTITWPDTTSIPNVDLKYKNPKTGFNTLTIEDIASGSTAEIPVNQTTADHGHARWSGWGFAVVGRPLLVPGQSNTAYSSDWTNANFAPFKVKVVAVRGADEYDEPAHRRYWANGSTIVLLKENENTINTGSVGREPNAPQPGYGCGNIAACMQTGGKIVPPGTTRLVVTMVYRPTTEGWPINNEKGLAVRTAKTSPQFATWEDLRVEPYKTRNGDTYVFEYKVLPDETDAFYQKQSTWAFFPNLKGAERDPNMQVDCTSSCGGDKYKLTIEAINDNWTDQYATGAAE